MKKKIVGIGLAVSLFVLCSPVSIAGLRASGPPCSGYGCPGFASAKDTQPKANKHRQSKRDRNAQPSTDQDSAASTNAPHH
jgi:hypothetical protein